MIIKTKIYSFFFQNQSKNYLEEEYFIEIKEAKALLRKLTNKRITKMTTRMQSAKAISQLSFVSQLNSPNNDLVPPLNKKSAISILNLSLSLYRFFFFGYSNLKKIRAKIFLPIRCFKLLNNAVSFIFLR